jgi:hypothetical protein
MALESQEITAIHWYRRQCLLLRKNYNKKGIPGYGMPFLRKV